MMIVLTCSECDHSWRPSASAETDFPTERCPVDGCNGVGRRLLGQISTVFPPARMKTYVVECRTACLVDARSKEEAKRIVVDPGGQGSVYDRSVVVDDVRLYDAIADGC